MSEKVVSPEDVPVPQVDCDAVESAGQKLKSDGTDVAQAGQDITSSWQGLEGVYAAPEAETLFASINPVATKGDDFDEAVTSVGDALITFAEEVRPIKARLTALKADAGDFQDTIAGDDDWREDEDKIDELDQLNNDILQAVFEYQRAERDCANAITSLFGGTTFVAADGEGPARAGEQAHGTSEALQGVETPWITPQEHDAPWYEDAWNGVKDFGVGIAEDLGSLVGLYGEDGWGVSSWGEWGTNLKNNYGDMLNGLGSLVGLYGEDGWGVGSFGEWWGNFSTGWTEFAHAIVPWREWGDRPGYVITQSALNIGSMFVGVGVVKGLVRGSRRAGGDADADADTRGGDADADVDTRHLQNVGDRPGQQTTQDLQNTLDDELDFDQSRIEGIQDSLSEAEGFHSRTTPVGGGDSPVDTDPASNGNRGQQQYTGGSGGSGDLGGSGSGDAPGGSGGRGGPGGWGGHDGGGDGSGDQQGGNQPPADDPPGTDAPSGDRPDGAPYGDTDAPSGDRPDGAPYGDTDAPSGDRPDGAPYGDTDAPSGERPGDTDGTPGEAPAADTPHGPGGPVDADAVDGVDSDASGPDAPDADSGLDPSEYPGHVDEDGVRRFDTDEAGERYGDEVLGDSYRDLPGDQRYSIYEYTRHSWPFNPVLRHPDGLEAGFRQESAKWWDNFADGRAGSSDHGKQLFDLVGGYRRITMQDMLDAEQRTDLTPVQRDMVDYVVSSAEPHKALDHVVSSTGARGRMIQTFDGFPTVEDMRSRVDTMDEAMDNSRLPETVEVQRGLHGFDHLNGFHFDPGKTDLHEALENLKGVPQKETGYTSTSLGKDPAVIDGNPYPFKLNLKVPEGSPGLWMGKESHYPDQRELILPRNLRYQITDVVPTGSGTFRIDAKVLPPE